MSEIKTSEEGNYIVYLGEIGDEYFHADNDIEQVKEQLEFISKNSNVEGDLKVLEFHVSVDDVQLMFAMKSLVDNYLDYNLSGGTLHVQLEDCNYDHFQLGLEDATKANDIVAILICQLGLKLGEHKVYIALSEPHLVNKLIMDVYNFQIKKS